MRLSMGDLMGVTECSYAPFLCGLEFSFARTGHPYNFAYNPGTGFLKFENSGVKFCSYAGIR